jgi:hypothetical protein
MKPEREAYFGRGHGGLYFSDLKICHFGGLGGPWGLQNHPKRWGAKVHAIGSPPLLWMVLKPPGAAQTPKMEDFTSNL